MTGWREQAACAYVDPDLWFPEKGASNKPAKRICAGCPVQADCLDDALANNEQWGIWGGVSATGRRALSGDSLLPLEVAREAATKRVAARERPPMADSAREHAAVITTFAASEAAAQLGVTPRTVERWRAVLREAS